MSDPDRTADADERPPWGQPGLPRRDCEPSRDNVLMLLATLTLVLGISSFLVVPLGLVALILGAVVQDRAWRDLRTMDDGLMDSGGRARTEAASRRAGWGLVLGGLGGILCGPFLLLLLGGVLGIIGP